MGKIRTHKVGPVEVCEDWYPGFAPVLRGVLQGVIADPSRYDHASRIRGGELQDLECYWRTTILRQRKQGTYRVILIDVREPPGF